MKVSLNWLKDYVDISMDPNELADKLTMVGLEVESVEPLGLPLENVYVGQISKIEKHPNADELSVCEVSLGERSIVVVTGAKNIYQGLKVPVALEGAVLPNGVEIEKADLRGILSEGMLCSEAELEIGDDNSKIMELPEDTPVGQTINDALSLNDIILDISIYANRPDCMSVLGIAREVAALTGQKLKYPCIELKEGNEDVNAFAQIEVIAQDKCPRYSARVIKNVEIKPSPLWLQKRLIAAGMRPINNVVDITNFVMLETGQPLHAFDYDDLVDHKIIVRTANQGEKLVTLDGVERELDPEMLMICDPQGPVCIAGVFGGKRSEVSHKTKTILLESATFSRVSIRRTSRSLGIFSEAAARFEKGLDIEGTIFALNRASELFVRYANGKVAKGIIDVRAENEKQDQKIYFRPEKVNELLGTKIEEKEMQDILERLEIEVDVQSKPWVVKVPSFRGDLELEHDVIEEIARHWGYERIPTTLPGGTTAGGQTLELDICDEIRSRLVGAGLLEAITYSFIHRDRVAKLGIKGVEQIELANPLSEDLTVMRTTLLPGLLDCLARNASRQQNRISIFELGAVFLPDSLPLKSLPKEERHLGIALMGARQELMWNIIQEDYDFYDIKGLLELVLSLFAADFVLKKGIHPVFHPERQAQVLLNGKVIAVLGETHPEIQRIYDLPKRSYLLELNIDALVERAKSEFKFNQLPRFPVVERDLALLVAQDELVGNILLALKEEGGELLKNINVFDVYQGKQIPEGKKSVAFSLQFQADRTLTDDEVNRVVEMMHIRVKRDFNAEIR
ncbi:MAG: phenylalanine--tRNA ligase subunit beta [Firmicutes bacterium]|nr:phenylalanine--tRNA ligase subunit beta [Bacillota bacterium]